MQGECAMKKEFKFGTDLDGKAKEELIRLAYEEKRDHTLLTPDFR